MSVLASKRKESRFEVIVFADELQQMFLEFMQRDFGVRDLDQFVRRRYAFGKDKTENFSRYRYLMRKSKDLVTQETMLIATNLRGANSIYPTTLHECEVRRDYQNYALAHCEILMQELQRIVETFDVDLNVYRRYVNAIDREIGLIKKWRQRDNKIKSSIEGSV